MAVDSIDRQRTSSYTYNHADYALRRRILRFLLRTIGFTLLAKVDQVDGLENFPQQGPALLMINHIALIDPIVVMHVAPRDVVPLAKIEVYSYPGVGIFPRIWGVIPVRREEFDRRAVQQALEVLKAGEIVLVAPEGTRSHQMSEGKEGVAYLASRSGAPVVPVAIDGTIGYPAFRLSERWKGPGAHITFGKPFYFFSETKHPGKEELRKMTDEAMYILAALLPEHRRGYYADLAKATRDTIVSV
jgi:1-acyl-sn-glycerol-3-phosphate acyltransferase